jgi:transcriptional regulator with XRE-family HTH domain
MHEEHNRSTLRALLGRDLVDLRQALDLTQQQLGERLGCSRETVSAYERGACLPDVRRLPRLLDLLVQL